MSIKEKITKLVEGIEPQTIQLDEGKYTHTNRFGETMKFHDDIGHMQYKHAEATHNGAQDEANKAREAFDRGDVNKAHAHMAKSYEHVSSHFEPTDDDASESADDMAAYHKKLAGGGDTTKHKSFAEFHKHHLNKGSGGKAADHTDTSHPEPENFDGRYIDESINIQEDMNALFKGEETLSEEFKTKAATIFEAAVMTRVKQEAKTLEEAFATRLEEQVEEAKTGLIEAVDGLLNYMVEQWMNDNVVALESGIKSEITESFIKGLHQLFKENYIEVPEDKADLVADLQKSVNELKEELTTAIQNNINLTKTINESNRIAIVDKISNGLTTVDSEKFRALAEELSFDNAENFETKLVTIKESYFVKTKQDAVSTIVTDSPVESLEEQVVQPKTGNSRYAAVLKHLNTKN